MTKFFGLSFERFLDRVGAVLLLVPALVLGVATASYSLPL
jgi:hypothetical protein